MAGTPLTAERLTEAGLGAYFRPRDVEPLGVTFHVLQRLVEDGAVDRVAHGLYRLIEIEETELETVAMVACAVPHGILCLLTALTYHDIGTQLPRKVWMAIPHKDRAPQIAGLPIRIVRFSGVFLRYGVVPVRPLGVPAQITNPARTVIDCFRFRRIVGQDVALEALSETLRRRKASVSQIWRAAEMCRAKTLVGPYLDAFSV